MTRRARLRLAALGLFALAALPLGLVAAGAVLPPLLAVARGGAYLQVPAASMKPALLPGDRILVARRDPAADLRGRVVLLRHPVNDALYARRVIALGGERVAMEGGAPVIAGTPVRRERAPDHLEPYVRDAAGAAPRCRDAVPKSGLCAKTAWRERLPGGASYTVLDTGPGPGDDRPAETVPEGHVFLLGDNRDNSLDSRFPAASGGLGMVPDANILGRVTRVHFSLGPRGLRTDRTWTAVR